MAQGGADPPIKLKHYLNNGSPIMLNIISYLVAAEVMAVNFAILYSESDLFILAVKIITADFILMSISVYIYRFIEKLVK